MKRRKSSALENATARLGRRPMAFRAKQRDRASNRSGSDPDTSTAGRTPAEGSGLEHQRAILAHVKERARELAASAPSGAGKAAAVPVTDERVAVFNPIGLANTKSGRRPVHPKACPRCGRTLGLTHRRSFDRMAAFVVPVHRWLCGKCGWQGLLIDRHEFKSVKRRIVRLIILLIAFLLSLAIMWYLDYLKYSYRPPVEYVAPGAG